MDKPISLSVKDFLIRKMAVKLMVPEKTIEAVVNHQFLSMQQAMRQPQHKSVELSGFGKFLFNQKKAEKKLRNMKDIKAAYERKLVQEGLTETKRDTLIKKIASANEEIDNLKPMMYVTAEQNLRGVEEQFAAAQEVKAGD